MKKTILSILAVLAMTPMVASAQTSLFQGGTGWSTSTKGELLVGTSSPIRYSRLPIGANGLVLTASSTSPYGMAWAASSGGVSSVSNSDGSLIISPTTGNVIASINPIQVDGSAFTTIDMLNRQLWNGGTVTYDWSTGNLYPASDIAFPNSFNVLLIGSDPTVTKSGLPLRLSWRTDSSSNGWLQFDDGAGNLQPIRANINADSVNATNGAFSFVTGDGSGLTNLQTDSAFTIGNGLIYNSTSTDLVGIGTTSPSTTLFVQGKGGTNPFAVASSTGTQMLTLTQAGRLGIGVSAPSGVLDISSPFGVLPFNITQNAAESATPSLGTWSTSDGNLGQFAAQSGFMMFHGQSGKGLILNGNGFANSGLGIIIGSGNSVGIGTTTLSKLAVRGAAGSTEDVLTVASSSNTRLFRILPSGAGIVADTLTWSSNLNSLGNNSITFPANNTASILVNSSGPSAAFALTCGSNAASTCTYRGINGHRFQTINTAGTVETMRITGSSTVGIGTTTPVATLTVVGTSSAPTVPLLAVASSTNAHFMTVLPNGNVGIGTTSPARTFSVFGSTTLLAIGPAVASDTAVCSSANGDIHKSANLDCTVSDERLKDNIRPLSLGGIASVMLMNPSEFEMKGTGQPRIGLTAQGVHAVDPRFASHYADGSPSGLDKDAVIAALVRAIQEQQAQIDELRALINK